MYYLVKRLTLRLLKSDKNYRVRVPAQAGYQNIQQKVFLRQFPLSKFLAKTLRVSKIAIKFPKKKEKKHNISGVRN